MLSEVDHDANPVLQIWKSEHVDQYRWVLTFGSADYEVFHGNAQSFAQAMKDIEHCNQIYFDSLRTVSELSTKASIPGSDAVE